MQDDWQYFFFQMRQIVHVCAQRKVRPTISNNLNKIFLPCAVLKAMHQVYLLL